MKNPQANHKEKQIFFLKLQHEILCTIAVV
jgi:hypothetical protein